MAALVKSQYPRTVGWARFRVGCQPGRLFRTSGHCSAEVSPQGMLSDTAAGMARRVTGKAERAVPEK